MHARLRCGVVALLAAIATMLAPAAAHAAVHAAFYETSFPEAWSTPGATGTGYVPSIGQYDQSDPAVLASQLEAMEYAKLDAALAAWNGPGTASDTRVASLLDQSATTSVKVAVWYRAEEGADPATDAIATDLDQVATRFASQPSYLTIAGKPAVFVQTGPLDDCSVLQRWSAANTFGFHLVFRTIPGYAQCADQPDGWFGYSPNARTEHVPGFSYTISPGFWEPGATQALLDIPAWTDWADTVQQMVDSNEPLQLVSSWNDWVHGSSIESSPSWSHPNCALRPASCPGRLENRLHKQLPDKTVAAAGDIACDPEDADYNAGEGIANRCRQGHTAALIDTDYVFALGDNQYEMGTLGDYNVSYDSSWGRFKDITYPVIGNHEYESGGGGYFDYFGGRAGERGLGYYSVDVGEWHVVSLNSNCSQVDCAAEEAWLRADLDANRKREGDRKRCTLAMWHQPQFTDGGHTPDDDGSTAGFWDALVADGAEVVLNGHDHNYQRFAPMLSDGTADASGPREFIVGTGGKEHDTTTPKNSEAFDDQTFGVLKLTLRSDGYDWQFVPETGGTFTDSGSEQCHAPGAAPPG
jgi:hypothetical protein